MASSRRLAIIALAIVAAALILYVSRDILLSWVGRALVDSQPPQRADAALVLAGDQRGNRILKACELAAAGDVPVILVSGPMDFYGVNEADLAIRFAIAKGCPERALKPVYIDALSTSDEADKLAAEIQSRNVHKLIVVTSDYHTARAGRIYRNRIGDSVEVQTVAAPDRYFTADGWWKSREGRKTVFFEVSKTIATWVGL